MPSPHCNYKILKLQFQMQICYFQIAIPIFKIAIFNETFFVQIAIFVLSPRLALNSLRHVLEVYRPMSYLTFLFCAKKKKFLLGIT